MLALKITVFGLTISSSWGNGHATPYRAILRALHGKGHHLTFYEKDVEYYYWRRDFTSCDYCNLVLYSSWAEIRLPALAEAADSDVVIVGSYCPEGSLIADEVLALSRPVRVFYDLDTPITVSNLASSDLDYLRRNQMSSFDLYLSFTGGTILKQLESEWNVRMARPLYGCVDPDIHTQVSPQHSLRCDLSYMGTYASDRQSKLDRLFLEPARAMTDSTFILAGSLYPRTWHWPANIRKFDHVAASMHPALYSSSRATLNLTREGMARSGYCPSGRFFEAAACGAPILSDWFEGLDSFFCPSEEIYIVSSSEDVISVLRMPDEDLISCAKRGRERVLAEHTGAVRADQLLSYVTEASCSTSNIRRNDSQFISAVEVNP